MQAASQLGTDRARISNTESGRLGVRGDRVETFASIYECADTAYVHALVQMVTSRRKGWWEEHRGTLPVDLLDLAELEDHARYLRAVQIMHIPGLLQTEEYAKAVLSTAVPQPAPEDLRRKLSFRMRRRDVLDKAEAPQCTFLIHEAALRLHFGGPEVTRAQLAHLREASERDNVVVRVLPFAAGGFPNAGSSTLYAGGPMPQLDTVQLDVPNGVALIDTEASLAKYRQVIDRTESLALTPQASVDFIHTIKQEV